MQLLTSRIEILHPILVHFPIALILTGAFARLILLFSTKKTWKNYIRFIYLWSLSLGFLGMIASILTGQEAEYVVNKIICDPTITHDHEDFAQLTLIATSMTLLIAWIQTFLLNKINNLSQTAQKFSQVKLRNIYTLLLWLETTGLIISVGLLTYTSHLGGTLVYEQGAAYLRTPNDQCDIPDQ